MTKLYLDTTYKKDEAIEAKRVGKICPHFLGFNLAEKCPHFVPSVEGEEIYLYYCRHPEAKANKGGWLIQCPKIKQEAK